MLLGFSQTDIMKKSLTTLVQPKRIKRIERAQKTFKELSIQKAQLAVEVNSLVTLEWKVGVLKQVVEMGLTGNGLKDDAPQLPVVVSAVSELNKMQGHHKPNRHIYEAAEIPFDEYIQKITYYQKEY
jgi:hypothetical protein